MRSSDEEPWLLSLTCPRSVAERELNVIARKMSWPKEGLRAESVENSSGPGNVTMIEIESRNVTEVFTGFGERGVRAEAVAERAVKEARRYLAVDVAAGEYLADQLLIPMALAGGGSFTTLPLSRHSTTNIAVIGKFLDAGISIEQTGERIWNVRVGD